MARQRWPAEGVLLGLLVLAASGCNNANRPVPANAIMAKEAFEKLGARVKVDEKLPGNPLVRLDCYDTKVGDADLKGLEFLPSLRELYLNETKVTDAGLKELKNLKNLEKLDLGFTDVTDAGLKELKELKGLHELNLRYTRVTDAGLKELRELESLWNLYLAGTEVTDAGLKELKEFKKLRSLDLQHTAITDAGLRQMKDFDRVSWQLSLGGVQVGGQVTEAGMKELQEARPNIAIDWHTSTRMRRPREIGYGLYWLGGIVVGIVLFALVAGYLVFRRRERGRPVAGEPGINVDG
jgi:hypothetical protein